MKMGLRIRHNCNCGFRHADFLNPETNKWKHGRKKIKQELTDEEVIDLLRKVFAKAGIEVFMVDKKGSEKIRR